MRWTAWLVAVSAGAVLLAAPPALADTADDAFEALFQATRATSSAAAAGIDVVQSVRYGSTANLSVQNPQVSATVPGGSRLRVHSTVGADGAAYLSVRFQPSGRLLAAAGVDPESMAPWATVLMLDRAARAQARRAGVPERTVITDVPASAVLDPRAVDAPLASALRLLLPPYASSLDEGWTTIEVLPQPDGTTVIRGSIRSRPAASDGEDACARPLVEVTMGVDSVVSSSRWTEVCPGEGTRTFSAVASYGPQTVQPPTRPRRAADAVLR